MAMNYKTEFAIGVWLARRFLTPAQSQPGFICLPPDAGYDADCRWRYWTGTDWQPVHNWRRALRIAIVGQRALIAPAAAADGLDIDLIDTGRIWRGDYLPRPTYAGIQYALGHTPAPRVDNLPTEL